METGEEVMIITGTRKGIGKYLAEYYISKGYTVFGCSRGEPTIKLDAYEHFCLDVADEPAVAKMVRSIYKKRKRIDVLINNAGAASMNHVLLTPLSSVEAMFRTNVYGTFLFSREVAKCMANNKHGRIVNLVTIAIPLKLEGESVYVASKSAVERFTQVLAKELASFNITCNSVGPTPVSTDLIRSVPEEKIQKILDSLMIKRLGTFEDISNVIDFFIAKSSAYITGQTIYLGGG
ncbi:MAG: SDR family oxidoreductase [Dehalococcoidales bacterium]|nr:SDR family oxidoreductase [Dehalococcoidales bacterium]